MPIVNISNTITNIPKPLKRNNTNLSINDDFYMKSGINNILGALIMVKNEEQCIQVTIDSVKDYIKHIIVYDTGSTDKTIEIVKNVCKQNNQVLHLKQGIFEGFPKSRNEALEYAECVPVNFLLMMDAADEFKTDASPIEFLEFVNSCPKDIGLVKLVWRVDSLEEHCDMRFMRNNSGNRYDLDHPVHEVLVKHDDYADTTNMFHLFQDRVSYGESSKKRYARDIELLLDAKPTKRNLYFLAQTYLCVKDYENSYKYYKLSIKTHSDNVDVSEAMSYLRAGFCAFHCKLTEQIIIDNFLSAIQLSLSDPIIDPYIYILKYYIETGKPEKALPYIDALSKLSIKPFTQNIIRNEFFDYDRWNLISVVCLMTNQRLDLGAEAIQKIIHLGKPDDVNNYKIYELIRKGEAKYQPQSHSQFR
jgi:glycosyltransferase involved in cell wall biosynthesis